MMRFQIVAVAGMLVAGSAGLSQAAEIDEQGARELRNNLNRVLSHDLARSGFIHVRPAEGAYEVTVDLAEFFDKISSSDFSISGLKPLTIMAAPIENGLWSMKENGDGMDVVVHSKLGKAPPSDVKETLGPYTYSGVFDPSISYIRSGDFAAKGLTLSSIGGAQTIEMSTGDITSKMATTDSAQAHKVDISATSNLAAFHEKMSEPGKPDVDLKADSIGADVTTSGVPIKEVGNLLHFVFEHLKAKDLSRKGSDRFKMLLRDALPLFDHARENVSVKNLTVSTDKGSGGASEISYSFGTDGLAKSARVDIGMKAQGLTLSDGLVPALYTPLVPSRAELQLAMPNMDFADAMDAFLRADFSSSKPLSKEESDRIGELLFPGNNVMIDMPKFAAMSPAYDLEMSGKFLGNTKDKKRFSMQLSILARDYDKSIQFVQNAAKADAQLNQVSFLMMMTKGFAKTDPDGRQRWDVNLAEDGTVTVNGQIMKLPPIPTLSNP